MNDVDVLLIVFICIRKKHVMKKREEGLGGKRISLTKVSDKELDHVTTDGFQKFIRISS